MQRFVPVVYVVILTSQQDIYEVGLHIWYKKH